MNIIHDLRKRAKLTQHQCASIVGTSQSTLAAYESGTKSPTLRTVERVATKLGLHTEISVEPELTREDRRSLAYHRAIVNLLEQDPQPVLNRARANLATWLNDRDDAKDLLERWKKWLDLPIHDLAVLTLHPGIDYRDMRQVSPFAGVMSAAQRTTLLKNFQKEDAA